MLVIAVTGNDMSCVGVAPPIKLPAIVITSFSITQLIAFFFMGISIAQVICFLITIGTAFALRMADLKRSRQIIGRF